MAETFQAKFANQVKLRPFLDLDGKNYKISYFIIFEIMFMDDSSTPIGVIYLSLRMTNSVQYARIKIILGMRSRLEEELAQLVEDITVNVGYPIYF